MVAFLRNLLLNASLALQRSHFDTVAAEHDSRVLELKSEGRVLAWPLAERGLHILALKSAAYECEHRVLSQKRRAECELPSANSTAISFFFLMVTSTSSFMINNPLVSQELMWIPYKLSLLSHGSSLASRLASATMLAVSQDTGLADLLRDVVAYHIGSTGGCQNLKRGWATYFVKKRIGCSMRSLRRALRASLCLRLWG